MWTNIGVARNNITCLLYYHRICIMMTSLNGNIFRVTDHWCGEFNFHRWVPRTKASDAELWCFLWSAPAKRLSEHSWGWWFKTLSRPSLKVYLTSSDLNNMVPGWMSPGNSHDMMMSSNGNISPALLVICAGNSPVTGEFLSQRPVTRSFDVFFDLCLNKRLSKQRRGWWFETPSRSLWRQCNGMRCPIE